MFPDKRNRPRFLATLLAPLALTAAPMEAAVAEDATAPLGPQKLAQRTAADTPEALPSDSLKRTLLEWIGANSDYDVAPLVADPPAVTFCEHGSTLVYKGKAIHFDDRLNGVYDETTKQICLARPWNASASKDVGVLLHELVHHVQFESKYWGCPQETEWEAYKLQEAWLRENGVGADFDWLFILFNSSCTRRDIHP